MNERKSKRTLITAQIMHFYIQNTSKNSGGKTVSYCWKGMWSK